MISWETLLVGFGFRFRSLLNWLISCYVLAVVLACFGVGPSGFGNVAAAADFVGLAGLGRWVGAAYSALGAGEAPWWLAGLLLVWLALGWLVLGRTYSQGVRDGHAVNLIPNCAFAAALASALWRDLVAPGRGWELGLVALLVAAWIASSVRGAFWEDRVAVAGLALLGVLLTSVYAFLAPPLWLADTDSRPLRGEAPDAGGSESATRSPTPSAAAPSPVRGLAKMEGGGRDGRE